MKPDVTFLVGYNVVDVDEDGGDYTIKFSNGASLAVSADGVAENQVDEIDALKGKTLVSAESQASGGSLTLGFARIVIKDDVPMQVEQFIFEVETDNTELTDPRFDGRERDLSVPEQPADRLADGPETPVEATDESGEE